MKQVLKRVALIFATIILMVSSLSMINLKTVKAADDDKSNMNTTSTIKIGLTKSVASLPELISQENNAYTRDKLDIQLKVYDSTKELNKAINSGEVNGAVTDLVNYSAILKKNKSWKITSTAPGYLGLASNKKYKTIKSLKNKTIAVDKKDGTKYYLSQLLKKNGMKMSDVKLKQVDKEDERVSELKDKKVDAAILSDPSISTAQRNGSKILKQQATDANNGNVVVFSNKVLSKNGSAMNMFYNNYIDSIKYFNKGGYATVNPILFQLGAPKKTAVEMNQIDVTFKKPARVNKSDFNQAMSYAKQQKINTKSVDFNKAQSNKIDRVK